MNRNDIILFFVVFGSMTVAVLFPEIGVAFQPFLLAFIMCLMFLSFLTIDFQAFLDTSFAASKKLAWWGALKMAVLPALLYWAFLVLSPDYAIPVLLLSGISTGVVAPFMADMLDADVSQVLRMVVATSLVVPFSLPCLVKALAGADIDIPLAVMIRLLALVVLAPVFAVFLVRKYAPTLAGALLDRRFPVSLTLFAVINFAVFSKYSSFFFQKPSEVLGCVGVAYALAAVYYGLGFLITVGRPLPERMAAAVSMGLMNNVLVIVFSSQFFGPLAPTLAAMYMFPFFTMIVPVRFMVERNMLAEGKS